MLTPGWVPQLHALLLPLPLCLLHPHQGHIQAPHPLQTSGVLPVGGDAPPTPQRTPHCLVRVLPYHCRPVTSHDITLHYIALHRVALRCVALRYLTLHNITYSFPAQRDSQQRLSQERNEQTTTNARIHPFCLHLHICSTHKTVTRHCKVHSCFCSAETTCEMELLLRGTESGSNLLIGNASGGSARGSAAGHVGRLVHRQLHSVPL